jgi:CubicO group peptidase (beta-lactamase class C family)
MVRVVIIFLICFFFHQKYLNAQDYFSNSVTQQLDSISTQDVKGKVPGIATAILYKGKVVYKKYAGYANFDDSSLISSSTRFNIASNGKQFTALAVLSLIVQKRLRLEDDIRKFLPLMFKEIKQPIQIKHLLTHTSGIRDYYDLLSLQEITWWKQSYRSADALQLLSKQVALNTLPGKEYRYSNSNYILLAQIVEIASGKSFRAYTDSLFQILRMPNTHFETDHKHIDEPIARSYFNFGSWTTYKWVWDIVGDGNLFTTLEDQIQWEQVVYGSANTGLSKQLIQQSQQLVKGTTTKQYGYGLEFGMYKGVPYSFHEGATGAWKATVLRFPEYQYQILTFANTGKAIPSQQSREMADIILNLDLQKTSTTTFLKRPISIGNYISDTSLLGTYLNEDFFYFKFIQKNGKIFLARSGRNDVELERESANIFHQRFDTAFKQEFKKLTNGKIQVTAYYTSHAPYSLTKEKVDWQGFSPSTLNGTYTNEETAVTWNIQHQQDFEYQVITGKDTGKAQLINPNLILYNGYALQFPLKTSPTKYFFLQGGRIRYILFKKN